MPQRPAALSRIAGDEGTADLFGESLADARRTSARGGVEIDRKYEVMKDSVRRKAKGRANQYERGIKAGVKRLRY